MKPELKWYTDVVGFPNMNT